MWVDSPPPHWVGHPALLSIPSLLAHYAGWIPIFIYKTYTISSFIYKTYTNEIIENRKDN